MLYVIEIMASDSFDNPTVFKSVLSRLVIRGTKLLEKVDSSSASLSIIL